jgi:hypothetical protein
MTILLFLLSMIFGHADERTEPRRCTPNIEMHESCRASSGGDLRR